MPDIDRRTAITATGLATLGSTPKEGSLAHALEQASVSGDGVAVICIDLDHFKEANDLHGHLAGDAILTEVARRLRASVAAPSFAARLGGDEFVVVQIGGGEQPAAAAAELCANLLEVLVLFVRDNIAIANLGEKDGRKMAPLLCTFFFFILTLNLMGLIPLFATATANINVTAALATTTLAVMIGGAIYKNGPVGFLHAFIPHGVPWPVLILLTPIEIMGMFIKTFSLTIRLFANMFAGHVVIYTLIGLVVMFGPFAFASIGLAVGIYVLKIVVALLQAYVFTLLSAMFIAQIHHPAH